ncbi:MAG: alpha/beta hydrolase [Candidatus Paceibacterota bacterium]|jgi:hypothetical protein
MKKQVLVIHGGDTFDTYEEYLVFLNDYEINLEKSKIKRWKETLAEKLGENFDVISPKMPNSMNAKYKEWKIIFEKYFPYLSDNLILVGHSLGGTFVAKYLSENDFPKKILATFLVSACYDNEVSGYSLGDFSLPQSLEKLEKQGGKVFLIHSKDDKVVSFKDFEKYKKDLPMAETMIFEDRGHFDQPEFPEVVGKIKEIV